MVESILHIYSALNFSVNAVLIWYSCSQILEICHIFKGFIGSQ
jgi:hypothetical protein